MSKLNHEPLKELFADLIEDVKKQVKDSYNTKTKSYLDNTEKALEKIKDFFEKVENDFKILTWKESLGIPQNKSESEKLCDFYNELFSSLESPFKQLSAWMKTFFSSKSISLLIPLKKGKGLVLFACDSKSCNIFCTSCYDKLCR